MGTKRERIFNFEVQRPVDYNEKAIQKVIDSVGFVYVDTKYDGIRGVIYFDEFNCKWRIVTRENIEILSIADRIAQGFGLCSAHRQCIYDCEVVIPGKPFDEASGLLRSFTPLADELELRLVVFDIVNADNRKRNNEVQYPLGFVPQLNLTVCRANRRVARSLSQVQEFYEQDRSNGQEGSVVKNPQQPYTPSKVQGWWKLKPKETQDGVITGFIQGTAGKANADLIVGFHVKLEDGSICNATGITQELMREVTANPEAFVGRYVEVERMEASGTGASRHPHFKCFRDMKGAEGVKS